MNAPTPPPVPAPPRVPPAGPNPAAPAPGIKLLVDFVPLAVFFLVNTFSGGLAVQRVLAATAAFMVATTGAMIVSRWKLGHVSPMLWMSGALVLVFGGLTLWFHDETFIKVKPTIVYAMFGTILAFGLATGRPLLKLLFESTYPGLDAAGWRQLTINWIGFFLAMATLNELVWRNSSWDFWVGFKLWGALPLTLVFALANIPMLLRHGLAADPAATIGEVPPEA